MNSKAKSATAVASYRRTLSGDLEKLENYLDKLSIGFVDDLPLMENSALSRIGRKIERLSERMAAPGVGRDEALRLETDRLEQKRALLEILYDVTTTINESTDLDQLLNSTLRKLMGVVGAPVGAAILLDKSGAPRLTQYVGLQGSCSPPNEEFNLFDAFTAESRKLVRKDLGAEETSGIREMLAQEVRGVISIPLRYQDRTVGVYHLLTVMPEVVAGSEMQELLESVGKHLGVATEKARLEAESKRLSIIEERTRLAHDLHDSLAQSLASLRFQIRNLDQTLQQNGDFAVIHEMEKVENSLDEAYAELRDLIGHFRSPVDKHGLYPALDNLIKRFRRDSRISAFLQYECVQENLPASLEVQIMRIVQEALNNVKKHAKAHTVRVLVRCDHHGNYTILVEDDGVGFNEPNQDEHPGKHIGLTIMKERAVRLGGELRVESEPGEGTRVELQMSYAPEAESTLSTASQDR